MNSWKIMSHLSIPLIIFFLMANPFSGKCQVEKLKNECESELDYRLQIFCNKEPGTGELNSVRTEELDNIIESVEECLKRSSNNNYKREAYFLLMMVQKELDNEELTEELYLRYLQSSYNAGLSYREVYSEIDKKAKDSDYSKYYRKSIESFRSKTSSLFYTDEVLRQIESNFIPGKFWRVPTLAKGFLQRSILFSYRLKQDKIKIHEWVIQSYQRQDDPRDTIAMFSLLKEEPEYFSKPSASTSFKNLLKSYDVMPTIGVGVNLGGNITQPMIISPIYAADNSNSLENPYDKLYQFRLPSYQFGLDLILPITNHLPEKLNLELATGLSFSQTRYNFNRELATINKNLDSRSFKLSFKEVQNQFEIPALLRVYRQIRETESDTLIDYSEGRLRVQGVRLYLEGGVNMERLIRDEIRGITRTTIDETGNQIASPVSGADVTNLQNSLRYKWNTSLVLGAGIRFKIRHGNIYSGLRYYWGLTNRVSVNNRWDKPELYFTYGYVDPNFRQDRIALILGITWWTKYRIKLK